MELHFNATVDSARGEIKLGSGWRAELYLFGQTALEGRMAAAQRTSIICPDPTTFPSTLKRYKYIRSAPNARFGRFRPIRIEVGMEGKAKQPFFRAAANLMGDVQEDLR